jgi:PAS domain S-box-containing protein
MVVIGWVVFGKGYTLPYLFIPLFIWIAFRFGQFEAACLILLMFCLSIWGAVEGVFIYRWVLPNISLLLTQIYISIASVMTMLLSSLISERNAALADSRSGNENLLQEITERKRAEEGLAHLAAIVESSEDAIIGKSTEGIILSWNSGAERLYGYRKEEVIGRSVSILIPQDLAGELSSFLDQVKRGKPVEHYETSRLRKDGSRIEVSIAVSPIRDSGGGIIGASTITRDITERKRMEEKLRVTAAYNRSLIEASLDPLVTIGHDGRITDVNTSTERVTGYTREELIETDFSAYFTDHEKADAGYQMVFREGMVLDYELEIRHRDGHVTPVLYNASLFSDETGKIMGVFAAARDITERKRAEEEIRKLNEELELRVKQRTAELEEKNSELDRMNKLFVGRELRMVELKKKIRELEKLDRRHGEKSAEPEG